MMMRRGVDTDTVTVICYSAAETFVRQQQHCAISLVPADSIEALFVLRPSAARTDE